jgi:hypothetical protein
MNSSVRSNQKFNEYVKEVCKIAEHHEVNKITAFSETGRRGFRKAG